MPIIEAQGLTKKFGGITAVKNLSLEVTEGEVLAFLGPNGAGKTTTIRMLAGIISPTSGRATVAGYATDKQPEQLHEVIGLLTETPGFYNRLSALRNLEFYAGFYPNIDAATQVEKYLKIMGLWERRNSKVGTFSKGMKQRLALARALLHEPKVLFLDEPTAGLDPEAARDVRDLIKRLSSERRTIFLSTHNLTEAEELSQRIAIIKTRLLALDTVENLRRRYFQRQVSVVMDSIPEALTSTIQRLPYVKQVSLENNRLLVELEKPERHQPDLIQAIIGAGGRVLSVSEERHSLEEVYLNLVREEKKS